MRRSYYCDGGDNSEERGYDEYKYGYDAYNRQISYYDYEIDYVGDYEDETTATYIYDAIGRRAGKKVDGVTTTHRWDGRNIVGENGTRAGTYYRGINLIGENRNNTVNYYVNDGHGNITALTNANGTTAGKRDYSAYGNMTTLGGEMNTVFNYCGEYQDSESGMIYLRNRYYSISMCRFTQEDPVKDGLNWYAYCGNNPVNFVDPYGLKIELVNLELESHESGYKKINEWKKSIKEGDYESDFRFKAIQELTDDELGYVDGEIVIVKRNDGGNKPEGTELVRTLIDSEEVISINYYTGESSASDRGIAYNPEDKGFITIRDDNGRLYDIHSEYQIIMAHEMIHIYNRLQGIERDLDEKLYYQYGYIDSNYVMSEEHARGEELLTVGLMYYQEIYLSDGRPYFLSVQPRKRFTENSIRKEQGRPLRAMY